ncbi:MAG: adenylyl-sulfate kinase [Candidatus Methylomirabilis oxyfera]|nr:adenylyl-sulfate kinase [Candidatus Methylomirabilis oxyfera]
MKSGFTVWFTGLSCAGKSTIAQAVARMLRERGLQVEVLDGDVVRENLSRGLGFSKADRDENIRRIAFVSKLLTRNGVATLVAAISPYRAAREAARREIGRFVEVYVHCPIEVCMGRDTKGLYRRAVAGEISAFTGISDPYEPPPSPELTLHTDKESPEQSAALVMSRLRELGVLPG